MIPDISALLQKLPYAVRVVIYLGALLIAVVIPMLIDHNVIPAASGLALMKLALYVTGGAGGLAGIVLAGQKRNGTLDFSGTAEEQAIAAAQRVAKNAANSAQQAVSDAAGLERVKNEVSGALNGIPAVVGSALGPKARAAFDRLTQ